MKFRVQIRLIVFPWRDSGKYRLVDPPQRKAAWDQRVREHNLAGGDPAARN